MPNASKVNVAIAALAVLVFHLLTLASGRITENKGLGFDGGSYANMVAGKMSDGTANTAVRPFVILIVRVPYALGLGMIPSFRLVNYGAAFLLYFVLARMLERRGLSPTARAVVVVNLALTIAVSKMLAYYPTLIDLGAMAVISTAFYLAATDRVWWAGLASIGAAASREFGVAVPLYGIHRALRQRQWGQALAYVPSLAVPFLIRMDAAGIVPSGRAPLSVVRLAENFRLWREPPFVAAFAYFSLTVFGGISLLLWLRPARVLQALRREPELITYTGFIVLATAVGDADIWRYLAYVLPAAVALTGPALADLTRDAQRRVLLMVTLATLVTQRPLQLMTLDSYFEQWFPLYRISNGAPIPDALLAAWLPQVAAALLVAVALRLAIRHQASARWA